MKKFFILFLMVISIFMVGCSQKESFDVSKITPPESDNIKILGEWEVTKSTYNDGKVEGDEVTDGSLHLAVGNKINISKDNLTVGDIIINNPNFKLKRMERNTFFKEIDDIEIKKELKDNVKGDYIDITSIYDSNKTYLNLISISDSEAYVLLSDKLVKIKKVSDNVKISVSEADAKTKEKNKNSLPLIDSKINKDYYKKDVGILLGIKEPARIKDGYFEEAVYKTFWISVINNKLQPIKVLEDSLLLPRVNGFSNISLKSNFKNGTLENTLKVTSKKKDDKEMKGEVVKKGIYEEITFVGNDYIGLESYYGKNFNGTYNSYSIVPIDMIDSVSSMDIVNLFGNEQEENYNISEANAIDKFNKGDKDYYAQNKHSNVTLQRKNGNWHLEGLLNNKKNFDDCKSFDININPVPVLINYDTLMVPWSQIVSLGRDIDDIVTSPNGKIAITLSKNKLSIYEVTDGRLGERLGEINIGYDEKIVMAEWAVGNYVKNWDETIEKNYGAKSIE